MKEELAAELRRQVSLALEGAPTAGWPVHPLKQDASNRAYFRVGTAPQSFVVMVMPVGEGASKSEEVTSGEEPEELPFVNVARYLSGLGVRLPRILRYDEPAGMMVLEDLGDVTFERALLEGNREALYTDAVTLLARLRARAERSPAEGCVAFSRAFDQTLYDWELHHFREWGLEARAGVTPTSDERAALDRLFAEIARALASEPRGLTHRDYQSRNLMVKDGELVLIDFQDALLGPRQYDLVALLRDSYVELELPLVERLLDRYLAVYGDETGELLDREAFFDVFHLLTVQRKLKDAGRFVFIDRVKGNPGFLPYVTPSLRYVSVALDERRDLPALVELRSILSRYVPELAATGPASA